MTKPRNALSVTSEARATARGSGRKRTSVETRLRKLRQRLLEISDLGAAGALLVVGPGDLHAQGRRRCPGAPERAACAGSRTRSRFDPSLGRLIDQLVPYAESLPYDSDDASLIRVAKRDFEKAARVPAEHVARANELGSASYDAWTRARPANDFAAMLPFLEKALDLSREYAEFFAPFEHVGRPADRRRRRRHDRRPRSAGYFPSCAKSWCRSCRR